ncbi:MAG TPA: TMEM175 family protein [Candidatus Aminicenantes bacterium]|nr:TMEM175 family protein [Candidatus Aminicenantes bacterium]HRY63813.1 TMEM175 family protein [Candidatus Aminicenantes bacterium]HRZ70726.1 TMEM175 family protein [Candidatus Aminicenantes bacterium]
MSEKPVVFDDKPGLDRILFFSDAVMACAITLLVMDLRMPEMGRGA